MKFTQETYLELLDEQKEGYKEYEHTTESVVVCKLVTDRYCHTGQVKLVDVLEGVDVYNYQDEEIFLVKDNKAFRVYESISGYFKTFNEYLVDLLGSGLKYDNDVTANKDYLYITSNEDIL